MTFPLYSNLESKLTILRISVQLNSLVSSNKGDEGNDNKMECPFI